MHQLAHAVKVMTDGEARMIGTVRLTNIDCTNRFCVQKAIDLLDAKPRGSWCLVRAYDEHPELSLYQQRHQARNKDLDKSKHLCHLWTMYNLIVDIYCLKIQK